MAKKGRARKRRATKGAPVPTVSVDGIEVLAGLLKQIVSGGAIGNRTDHSLTYGMFAVPTRPGRVGTLRIEKRVAGDGMVLKLTMSDGQCRTCVQKVNATMRCRNDRLSTPLEWSLSEEMFMDGRPVPLTKISKTASVNRRVAEISDVSGTRKIDLPGAWRDQQTLSVRAHCRPAQNGVILRQVGIGPDVNMVDSFFDVFFDIEIPDDGSFDPGSPSVIMEFDGHFLPQPGAIPGDADLDGDVDLDDFVILKTNFGVEGTDWGQANFNADNTTDLDDFVILKSHFGQ